MQRLKVAAVAGVSLVVSIVLAFDLFPGGDDTDFPFATATVTSPPRGDEGERVETTTSGAGTGDTHRDAPEATSSSAPERDVVVSVESSTPPAATGSHVSPDDVGVTVGATDPSAVIDGDIAMVTDHELLADMTVNGCITVDADHVTIRNVTVTCDHTYPIKATSTTGTRLERVSINCMDDPRTRKGVYFERSEDFGVDRVDIAHCDDQFFIDGGLGDSWITNSVFHDQAPASEAHTDGMQIGTFERTTGTLLVEGNWWEYNRSGCCANAVLFTSGEADLTIEIRTNSLDGDFGVHVLRCRTTTNCIIEDNTLRGTPAGLFAYTVGERDGGTARCNRYIDGALIPARKYLGITVDNRGCRVSG